MSGVMADATVAATFAESVNAHPISLRSNKTGPVSNTATHKQI